jgi:hypothetical protein
VTTTLPLYVEDPADGCELELLAELELKADAASGGVEIRELLGFLAPAGELFGWYTLADFGPHAERVEAATRVAFELEYWRLRAEFHEDAADLAMDPGW